MRSLGNRPAIFSYGGEKLATSDDCGVPGLLITNYKDYLNIFYYWQCLKTLPSEGLRVQLSAVT